MAVTDLIEEHRRLLDAVEGNERQLAGPRPDSYAALAEKRWALARELLLHLAHDEAEVLRPLIADKRPHVAAEAARSLAEQHQLLADFKAHVRHWGALAGEAQWPDYVRATRALMQRIRRRMQAEECSLYRFLPAQRDTAPPPAPTYYRREAVRIGEVIFKGTPLA